MKKNIQHSFASITSNFLKIVIHTEAHSNSTVLGYELGTGDVQNDFMKSDSNSTVLGYEPPTPESLTQFKKDLFKKKK